jgi:peptidoglycan/xylan/chitin deacetylase (PgdA/CDA1 family)
MWSKIRFLALLVVSLATLSSTALEASAGTVPASNAGALEGTKTAPRSSRAPAPTTSAPAAIDDESLEESPVRWPFPRLVSVNFGSALVPVRQPLEFVFDRPPGGGLFETSLQITPSAQGEISWPNRHTLRFQPGELLFGTNYEVLLLTRSQNRIARVDKVGFTFTTEPAPAPGAGFPYTLTFDDCGSPGQVAAILDALSRRGLHAIFFPTGQCRDQNPGLVPTLIARGHRVGNHSYSHPQLTKLSNAAISAQISAGVASDSHWFRPPYGDWDGPRGRVARIAESQGYQVLMWDVDTRDWAGTSAAAMVQMIHARGGIVLMHMHGAHTVEAILSL